MTVLSDDDTESGDRKASAGSETTAIIGDRLRPRVRPLLFEVIVADDAMQSWWVCEKAVLSETAMVEFEV